MNDHGKRQRYSLARLAAELKRQRGRRDRRVAWRVALVGNEALGHVGSTGGQRLRRDPWARRRFVTAPRGRPRLDTARGAGGYDAFKPRNRDRKALHQLPDPEAYVIAVLDAQSGKLGTADRTCLAAARQIAGLDSDTAVLVLVDGAVSGLEDAGADRVSLVPGIRALSHDGRTEGELLALLDRIKCRSVVFCDSTIGRHSARTLAARMGIAPAIGAHEIGEQRCVARCGAGRHDAVYNGMRVLTAKEGFVGTDFSVRFEARAFEAGIHLEHCGAGIKDLGPENTPADQIPLEEAPFVLCGGAGVSDWPLFNRLADQLNATRAGTRVVCDAGFLPRERQVGASGSTSSASVYVALGLSGAIQHLQGIENCEVVLAVNVDAAAPIIKRADTSYIADADEVMVALLEQFRGVGQ